MRKHALRMTLAPFVVLAASTACAHREPPSLANPDGADVPAPAPPARSAASSAAPVVSSAPLPPPIATVAPVSTDVARMAPDAAEPQTRDRPKASSPDLALRARALFDAIAKDEPAVAMPFFFPKEAYAQTKAVPNPTRDWQERLVRAFERDIHALHRRVHTDAKYIGLDIPEDRGRWVEPEEEYNRIGYYRVFGSRIRYEQEGRERFIDLKSLISWRGEWYIVHLSGFK